MSILQALILGIVQGLTEFLPISSSGHLVIIPHLLGWKIPPGQVFPFNVLVQLGTVVAVIGYFRNDLSSIIKAFIIGISNRRPFATIESRLGWLIILATIPAGLIGLFTEDIIEAAFHSIVFTALFLYVTAILLFVAERIGKRNRTLDKITWKDALLIGFFQVLAVFPGISRSGATIAGGLSRHISRTDAARFSFLMSIPIMVAAGLLSALDLINYPGIQTFLPVLLTGFISAGIIGYISIHWLLAFLNRNSLSVFAVYCILVGSLTLIITYVR